MFTIYSLEDWRPRRRTRDVGDDVAQRSPRPVGGTGLRSELWAEFRRELDRSRRFGREFVLIRIEHGQAPSRRPGGSSHTDTAHVAHRLRPFLRSIDCTWSDTRYLYVLLPESDRRMGALTLARLQALEAAGDLAGEARLVAFPVDGLTSGALFAALDDRPLSLLDPSPPRPAEQRAGFAPRADEDFAAQDDDVALALDTST